MNVEAESEWWRVDLASDPPKRWRSPAATEAQKSGAFQFRALLVFTFILVISPQSLLPALASLRIAFVTAVVAIAACLVDRLARREPLSPRAGELRLTALLAGWAVLTIPLSFWPGGSVSFLLDVYFKSVAIFWLLCSTVDTQQRLRRVLWTTHARIGGTPWKRCENCPSTTGSDTARQARMT